MWLGENLHLICIPPGNVMRVEQVFTEIDVERFCLPKLGGGEGDRLEERQPPGVRAALSPCRDPHPILGAYDSYLHAHDF